MNRFEVTKADEGDGKGTQGVSRKLQRPRGASRRYFAQPKHYFGFWSASYANARRYLRRRSRQALIAATSAGHTNDEAIWAGL
jgi:hypothetical protein